jgi:hypothetical protein
MYIPRKAIIGQTLCIASNVRVKRDTSVTESTAHVPAFPCYIAVGGDLTGVAGILSVLRIGTVGVILLLSVLVGG